MRTLADNSVGSIVTDPPYELGFMCKKWDNTGISNSVAMWKEALRVLKPGGHLLAFSGSTGKAAIREGFNFIGIDMTPEYVDIARARIQYEVDRIASEAKALEASVSPQADLFAEHVA